MHTYIITVLLELWMDVFLEMLILQNNALNNDSFKVIYFALNRNLQNGNFRWVFLSVHYLHSLYVLTTFQSLISDTSHSCDSYLSCIGIWICNPGINREWFLAKNNLMSFYFSLNKIAHPIYLFPIWSPPWETVLGFCSSSLFLPHWNSFSFFSSFFNTF